jgi:DNA repair exonuclease SbcCD ATPase subunit
MHRFTWPSLIVLLLLTLTAVLSDLGPRSPAVAAQEEEARAEEEQEARRRELEVRARELDQRLNEVEQEFERARDQGDEARARELRNLAERLLDELEHVERSFREVERGGEGREEAEEREQHIRNLEINRLELEVERLHHELQAVQQESAIRMAELTKEPVASASYAITQSIHTLGEEEAIEFLSGLLEETENHHVQRIIRHHLARLRTHTGQHDAAIDDLRALILGPDNRAR